MPVWVDDSVMCSAQRVAVDTESHYSDAGGVGGHAAGPAASI